MIYIILSALIPIAFLLGYSFRGAINVRPIGALHISISEDSERENVQKEFLGFELYDVDPFHLDQRKMVVLDVKAHAPG